MKICKDCKHADTRMGESILRCVSPKNKVVTDPVTGEQKRAQPYCSVHRLLSFPIDWMENLCGSRARWFEPKPAEETP
jgi:hypothetical protein